MYDKDKLMEYRNKHPNFKHLYNIVFSKPTDFVTDFTKLNLNFLRVSVLEKLVEIIYYYPRSEYYSSEAIKILVFVAKELAHATNIEDSQHVAFELTQACEYANFALVEMLEGNRVHDYQKYLIIRHLFKDSTSLNITLKSFSIKQVVYYTNNSQNDNPSLPFLSKYYEIIESLVSKSESYPLSKICKYIIQQTE